MSYILVIQLCTLVSPNHWSPHCSPLQIQFPTKAACVSQAEYYNSAFPVAKAWDYSARLNEPMLIFPAECEEAAE